MFMGCAGGIVGLVLFIYLPLC